MDKDLKLSVLFIDDEKDVLDSIKRMLYSMRRQWNIYFALSGKEAIEMLKSTSIDVIVCDIRMPDMDGTAVLKFVHKNYPNIIRIVLSGFSDRNKILEATSYAHQYMSKPTDGETIISKIASAFDANSFLNNSELRSFIAGIKTLPTLPDAYLKLEEEISKEDFSLDKVASIVQTNPMLVAKILQVVNSSFFGLPIDITKISEALSYLGVNILKALVLHSSAFNTSDVSLNVRLEIDRISKHSLKTANTVKLIAKILQLSKQTSDEAFLAAILHDIGKIVLLMRARNFSYNNLPTGEKLLEIENKTYGFSHSDAGAYLLSIWGLSEQIIETAMFHHRPNECQQKSESPLAAVYLANQITTTDEKVLNGLIEIYETGDAEKINSYLNKHIHLDTEYLENAFANIDYLKIIKEYLKLIS